MWYWGCWCWISRNDCCPHLPVLQLTYLPPPWGECRSSEMGLDFFPVYSITACRIDCETRYIVENCNCRMVHMPGQCQGTAWDPLCSSHPSRKHCVHSTRTAEMLFWERLVFGPKLGTAEGNIQSGKQGSILVSRSVQMFEECSSQCSPCLLIVCCSYLLEFSVQVSKRLQFLHPGVAPVQTSRCLLLSSRWFPSCIQMSSTLSDETKVHQPANR